MKRKCTLWVLFIFTLNIYSFETVYITGEAFGGWSNNKPEVMKATEEAGVFEWSGNLFTGEFKFLLTLNSWTNCFNAEKGRETIVTGKMHKIIHVPNYYVTGGDYPFVMEQAGRYKIIVNTNDMTMVVEKENGDISDLWITGSALNGAFEKLVADPKGVVGRFRYFGTLQSGELKIVSGTDINEGTSYFLPVGEDVDLYGESTLTKTSDSNRPGFTIVAPDNYFICIDIEALSLNAFMHSKENLYIVGGATKAGWDCFAAIPLKKEKEAPVYTYEGELRISSAGEDRNLFKFLAQKDWRPVSFHPQTKNESIANSATIVKNSPQDAKWQLPEGQQGYYTITLNTLEESLHVIYHGENLPSSLPALQKADYFYTQNQSVYVCFEGTDSMEKVTLFDISGKQIDQKKNLTNGSHIGRNLGGIYTIRYFLNGRAFTEKVIVR